MPGAPRITRPEWPRIVIPVALGLLVWHAVNRFVLEIYPPDISEDGRFRVIAYGSDANTARREQIGMFNRAYRAQGVKVDIVPNGSNPERIPTTSAAGNAPDILDCYPPEDLRLYIRKGIARPLNGHLKAAGIDLPAITWAARLDDLRVPNPDWKPGDDPLDRHIYYAVPNNMDVPMAWFNRTLYLRIRDERAARGLPTPPEPHLHWTWWDYAALGKVMHRRGADGRFLTFGASAPERDLLVHQAALGLRGEDPAAFAALDSAERRRRGLDGLSWDEAASLYLRGSGGAWRVHPNRVALMQALQFDYDLVHALGAAPSSSDAQQMASVGGFASGGDLGRFKGGMQGLCIAGRWFVGQVRNDVSFDWRLLRLPRWVPYEEWASWQERDLAPGARDGAWGDADPATAWRGYGNFLGGRMSFISSSCRDPERAFRFLEFLVLDEDFNRALLLEDGMGANQAIARAYLSGPDPIYPDETRHRPVEHELASLERLVARPSWPAGNHRTGRETALSSHDARESRPELLAAPGTPIAYAPFARLGPTAPSSTGAAAALAPALAADLEAAIAAGLRDEAAGRDRPAAWPSAATLAVIAGAAAALIGLRLAMRGGRRHGA